MSLLISREEAYPSAGDKDEEESAGGDTTSSPLCRTVRGFTDTRRHGTLRIERVTLRVTVPPLGVAHGVQIRASCAGVAIPARTRSQPQLRLPAPAPAYIIPQSILCEDADIAPESLNPRALGWRSADARDAARGAAAWRDAGMHWYVELKVGGGAAGGETPQLSSVQEVLIIGRDEIGFALDPPAPPGARITRLHVPNPLTPEVGAAMLARDVWHDRDYEPVALSVLRSLAPAEIHALQAEGEVHRDARMCAEDALERELQRVLSPEQLSIGIGAAGLARIALRDPCRTPKLLQLNAAGAATLGTGSRTLHITHDTPWQGTARVAPHCDLGRWVLGAVTLSGALDMLQRRYTFEGTLPSTGGEIELLARRAAGTDTPLLGGVSTALIAFDATAFPPILASLRVSLLLECSTLETPSTCPAHRPDTL